MLTGMGRAGSKAILAGIGLCSEKNDKGIATRNEGSMEISDLDGVQTLYTALIWSSLCMKLVKTPYPRVRTALRSHPRGSPRMSDSGAYKMRGRHWSLVSD